jgi:hypothetical protein
VVAFGLSIPVAFFDRRVAQLLWLGLSVAIVLAVRAARRRTRSG